MMTREACWSTVRRLAAVAEKCPGFAMCRVDFLGTGICPAVRAHEYAAYYPQGRLRLIKAVADGVIPLSPAALDIARSCSGCGVCDKQCFFVAELQPMKLFLAFRDLAAMEAPSIQPLVADPAVHALEEIVGAQWATHDPAHRIAYAGARSPMSEETLPRYVVLPQSSEEVAALVKACARLGLPYVVRGSGTSLNGALTQGLLIDTTRMREIEIDADHWLAKIGPGALAFDLQTEACKHGLRANVAEPAASVCANIMTTNMHSLFSYAYGLGADHVVSADFVDQTGALVTTREPSGPNPFQYHERSPTPPGICTGMSIRLFPKSDDETAALVPFGDLTDAVEAARRLAERRIGVALGILSTTYMSFFAGHTGTTSHKIRSLLEEELDIACFLLVVGHLSVLATIKELVSPVVDHATITKLMRALPHIGSNPSLAALIETDSGTALYKTIFSEATRPLLAMALDSGTADFQQVPEDLRAFYRKLYRRNELVDPVWLNTFRILPARMGRGHQFASQIAWVPLRPATPVRTFADRLSAVAERHAVEGALGYLVPIDHGTRAIVEFDFYFDASIPDAKRRVCAALNESTKVMDDLARCGLIARRGAELVGQGMARYQSYLFDRKELR